MGYSVSQFWLFDTCKHAWKCSKKDKLPEEETTPQICGKKAHKFAERYTKHCIKRGSISDRDFATNYLWDAADDLMRELEIMADRFADSFPVNFQNPLVEQKLAFDSMWRPLGDFFSKEAFFRLVMDLFYIEDGALGPLGVITDYKTSWKLPTQKEVDDSLQLKIYSFAAFLLYPEIEEVLPRLFFMRYGAMRTRSEPYIRPDLEDVPELIQKKIDKIEAEKEFKPSLNSLCGWCGYTPYCPLFKNSLATVTGYDLQTFADAQRAAEILCAAQFACKKLNSRLKKYVDMNGPITVSDQKLGYRLTETIGLDAEEITTILGSAGISKDIIWSALGVTAAALTKALKGTGEGVALAKALASGIKKPGTKFQWIKL